jgi:hypothetical protein
MIIRKKCQKKARRETLQTRGGLRRPSSGALSSQFLDQTIEEWQPFSKRNLTREDAREIIYNITGFIEVLSRWERAERQHASDAKIESISGA